ncbi:alanine--tRNA ligase [Paenibacillus piri]|uniref:Alanine--tRNA ligase n=1 Tax=Paenibacillus piri TaxID=2547395 RepID=A0A4R5KDQ1_9BACL|nr:alanine--tRNA ligase [Paenibacillus piri]TDF92765.1 alanine--tRNA ligase [Paenibacillus piri]
MKLYASDEIRTKYLEFFQEKNHAVISSSSVIPDNDPTVLFTTAGMHPLIPYLLGEKHPSGTRLTNIQKCIRTGDIEEVGDETHCTFFEMMGNWSLGDYFKHESIAWSWEFITSSEWLGIPKSKIAVTVFEGDDDAPCDTESYDIWRRLGQNEEEIFFLPKADNWWGPAGQTGPCGPDTEIFIISEKERCGPSCSPACGCGRYVEFWNNVFLQYNKTAEGKFEPLTQKNVDTGMGLERVLVALNGGTVYDSDLFSPIFASIESLSGKTYEDNKKAYRVIADHTRTAVFILGDTYGITPSNVDQGYVLRRLIRRAVRFAMQLGIHEGGLAQIAEAIVDRYKLTYPELQTNRDMIIRELQTEEARFQKTLVQGLREFEKISDSLENGRLDGEAAFKLYDTFGFPIELTLELAEERSIVVDFEGYRERLQKHKQLSQAGAAQKFKGGLADHSTQTANLHSATHLLHAALRKVLGDEVAQKGSNITAERLRFDFSYHRKMTNEEIAATESIVNEAIAEGVEITFEEVTLDEARNTGAIGLFESKYGEKVKVYTIGMYSKEICGGPHAANTAHLGSFKIVKEESSSSGVRRIKAVLTQP